MHKAETQVRSVMGKIFGVPGLEIPSSVSQASFPRWDSLTHMNLMLALEDELGIEFSDDEIAGLSSLQELIESVRDKY